ncbi:hypothetical protein F4827_006083 [Paraburkholderia bannensis]|uniref:DUF4123 domain-containing protein n=1 Tax=Paraburkholderia bannensis TaxID=765414 RepID=A0A7W9WW96_9BURK|nr:MULTISPECIES: DUF4123 domain-containing protein [Paraburkholderia]MBB3261175.1 hypothetical protein [Paraburkholderia sp. WP4_3_2]MBB6106212.1 hypothetical protein [Paraburkholderia bannensis]
MSTSHDRSGNIAAARLRYVLIDAARADSSYWSDLTYLPIVPERFRAQPELFPILVDIHALGAEGHTKILQRAASSEQQDGVQYIHAFLDAATEPSALAAHLIRRMSVRRPDGVEDVLRFYDPFVFRHLRWLLDVHQLDGLLGPVSQWYWPEPDGMWHSQLRVSDHASLRPLRLTPEQWPTLLRMADLNVALRKLSHLGFMQQHDTSTAQQIDRLLAEAWGGHGMSDRQDRLLFAIQASYYHRHIHKHPVLQSRLNQAATGAMTFVTACADLDDPKMRQLAEELEQIHANQ